MIRSCFFKRRFSETRVFASPGLSSLAIVARMWAKSRKRFIMSGEIRRASIQVQGDERPVFKLKLLIRHAQIEICGIIKGFSNQAQI
jgi:hypothetical protein